MRNLIFKNLIGKWNIYRKLSENGRANGTVKGVATITIINDALLIYNETGKWEDNNSKTIGEISKTYQYKYTKESDEISKYFDEDLPRLFYKLKFDKNNPKMAKATHLCAKDNYNAIYNFYNENFFELTYVVHGPKKEQVINTLFTRQV